MKFDELYPNHPEDYEHDIVFEYAYLFKHGEPIPCWNCGELTSWIDIAFEANLCSEECERKKWDEYFTAVYGESYTNRNGVK